MAVISKKEEKVNQILSDLGAECSYEEFSREFKERYPNDWERIIKTYKQHENRDKKGKGHPMPDPEQYMKNMFKVGKSKMVKE